MYKQYIPEVFNFCDSVNLFLLFFSLSGVLNKRVRFSSSSRISENLLVLSFVFSLLKDTSTGAPLESESSDASATTGKMLCMLTIILISFELLVDT